MTFTRQKFSFHFRSLCRLLRVITPSNTLSGSKTPALELIWPCLALSVNWIRLSQWCQQTQATSQTIRLSLEEVSRAGTLPIMTSSSSVSLLQTDVSMTRSLQQLRLSMILPIMCRKLGNFLGHPRGARSWQAVPSPSKSNASLKVSSKILLRMKRQCLPIQKQMVVSSSFLMTTLLTEKFGLLNSTRRARTRHMPTLKVLISS